EFTLSFSSWAYKVLVNVYLNYYKKKQSNKGKQVALPDYDNVPGSWAPDPDLENALIDCLRKICANNNRYARILNLYYQGFSTEEVCRKLKISSANAYVILARARSLLKTCLEKGEIK
ncbi:MAG: RNA polymerase sigma factor, partial [candidate division Zixibacteria bacterium]|nr:RNA polymerase sigma factor [candidate division Zixibacteria bacterium]